MNRKKITLTNNFHDTEITLLALKIREGLLFVSEEQATKARKRLCGSDTCLCGNSLGERPAPQDCVPTQKGYLYYR